jgi:hypothetical protein
VGLIFAMMISSTSLFSPSVAPGLQKVQTPENTLWMQVIAIS